MHLRGIEGGMEDTITTTLGHGNGMHRRAFATGNMVVSLWRHGKALIYQNGVLCWSGGHIISHFPTLVPVRIILYRHRCGGRFGQWMGQLHTFTSNAGQAVPFY